MKEMWWQKPPLEVLRRVFLKGEKWEKCDEKKKDFQNILAKGKFLSVGYIYSFNIGCRP
jgi:hypothetical protein